MSDTELEKLDPSIASLVKLERDRPPMPAELRDAAWARLEATLALGPDPDGGGSGGDAGAPPGPSAPPRMMGRALGGARAVSAFGATFLAGGVVGAAIMAAVLSRAPSDPAPSAPSAPPAPPAAFAAPIGPTASAMSTQPASSTEPVESSAPAGSAALAASSARAAKSASTASATPSVSASASASARKDGDLAAERSLLDEARAALARGQSQTCLSTLARHQVEFPRGRLSEEREGLWIQALVVSGRRAEARSRAEAFHAARPNSLLWPAIEAAVGKIP